MPAAQIVALTAVQFERQAKLQLNSQMKGLKIKTEHTIVKKWPYSLEKSIKEPGGQQEFDELLAAGHTGMERYMEWTAA